MNGNAPQSLAELERWAATVETMELADGENPGKDTLAARAAVEAARRAGRGAA